jgi:hypothetical protein
VALTCAKDISLRSLETRPIFPLGAPLSAHRVTLRHQRAAFGALLVTSSVACVNRHVDRCGRTYRFAGGLGQRGAGVR